MTLSKDALKKLSPEARIKKLKEMDAERKKEGEESKKLLEQSIGELERDEAVKKIKLPEEKKVDIDALFRSQLEETVRKEKPPEGEPKNIQYMLQTYDDLKEMQNAYGANLTDEQKMALGQMYNRINQDEKNAEHYHSAPDEARAIASGAKKIIKELLSGYKKDDNEWFYHTH